MKKGRKDKKKYRWISIKEGRAVEDGNYRGKQGGRGKEGRAEGIQRGNNGKDGATMGKNEDNREEEERKEGQEEYREGITETRREYGKNKDNRE